MRERIIITATKDKPKVTFTSDCLDASGFYVVEVDGTEICRDWYDKVVHLQTLCTYLELPWEEVEITEEEWEDRYW